MKNKDLVPVGMLKSYGAELFILFFSFLLYANTIPNDYSLDDQFVAMQQGTRETGMRSIPELFSSPYYLLLEKNKGGEYRPLAKVSFALEKEFFGENPHVGHFFQALLYALTCVVLYSFLTYILPAFNKILPFVAVLLFAAHPIHTEVVASLKNREELFSFLFSLLFLFAFLKAWNEGRHIYWAALPFLFLLAIMSKQSALILILWAPLFLYFTIGKVKPVIFPFVSVALFLFFVLYAWAVSLLVLNSSGLESGRILDFQENPLGMQQDFLLRLGTAFNCMGFYLTKLIYPHPLGFFYGYNMIPLQKPWEIMPLLYFILHLALFIWAIRGMMKRDALAFSIMIYLFAIAPYLNLAVLVPGIVGERFALFASLGFCLSLALLIMRITGLDLLRPSERIRPLFWILLIPILLVYSVKTYSRNKDWNSFLSLFSADVKYLENSYLANYNYGDELYRAYKMASASAPAGMLESSLKHYKRAIEIYPNDAFVYAKIAEILAVEFKKYEEAATYLQKAIALKPGHASFHFDLGACHQQLKQNDSAILHYKTAIRLNDELTAPLLNLGVLFSEIGQQDSAIYYNQLALQREPDSEVGVANMGFFYKKKGDFKEAHVYFNKAIGLNPNRQDVIDALQEMNAPVEDEKSN